MLNRIKISILAAAIVLLSVTHDAQAETPVNDKFFGLGVQLGDPLAVTMKMLFTEKIGIQLYVGAGYWWDNENYYHHDDMFMTGIDVVWHPMMIYDGWKTCALNWTIGVGGALGLYDSEWYDGDDDLRVAGFVRMVTGVNLWFKKFPLEVFVELDPAIAFLGNDYPGDHEVDFHFQWVGAGGRWYF